MSVKNLEFPISEDIFLALNEKSDEVIRDIKTFSAIKFFEAGKLSLGKAAKLAEMDKTDFMGLLSKQKISVYNYSAEEVNEDVENIRRSMKGKGR
ncbi:MAG: UPF0175 family protein [bacterium]